MALAIRCDELIRSGVIENYAAIARLGHVTRARVSQIMNLLNLAPDIQEAVAGVATDGIGAGAGHPAGPEPIAAEADCAGRKRWWRN